MVQFDFAVHTLHMQDRWPDKLEMFGTPLLFKGFQCLCIV